MRVVIVARVLLVAVALVLVVRSIADIAAVDVGLRAASVHVSAGTPRKPEQALRAVHADAAKVSLRYKGASSLTRLAADSVSGAELASMEVSRRVLERAPPDYVSVRLGFSVYGPATAAGLYIVEREAAGRLLAMSGISRRVGEADKAWGLGLRSTTADRVPTAAEVASAIEDMRLPRGSLSGVRVFILPFSLAGTSGLSWPDLVVIGSRPPDYETIDTQLQFTVAHEVGHVIHYRTMGPAGSAAWREYMRLRRIPNWRSGGRALTPAWDTSVEESFAEDVRVLLGGIRSAQAGYGTIYGDPRTLPGMRTRLIKFIAIRIASTTPGGHETSTRAVFASASSHLI